MLNFLLKKLSKVTEARTISNHCLFNRHEQCVFKGSVCDCYCHNRPEVLAALRDAAKSLQEPAFDFEESTPGITIAARAA